MSECFFTINLLASPEKNFSNLAHFEKQDLHAFKGNRPEGLLSA